MTQTATLYRMVMPEHICPYGLKAKHLLERKGFTVDDHWLETRAQTDAFKAEHDVKTTPQTFIDGRRIGGYDDLRRHFGLAVRDPGATSYTPVIALFAMTALMALAASFAAYGSPFTLRAAEWFISFSMIVLALLKLQNVESFSTMFLNYDLLARRWIPYSYVYPFAEGLAGVLMTAHALPGCRSRSRCSSPSSAWCRSSRRSISTAATSNAPASAAAARCRWASYR